MSKLLVELKSVLHTPTYYVITIIGGIGFEIRGTSSVAYVIIIWFLLSSIDIGLGRWNAVITNKNNSRDLTNGLIKKSGEMLIGIILSCSFAHINYMVIEPGLSLILGWITIGVPILFMYGEVQSIIENLLIIDGRKSRVLLFLSKGLGLALDLVWDRLESNIERKMNKPIASKKKPLL